MKKNFYKTLEGLSLEDEEKLTEKPSPTKKKDTSFFHQHPKYIAKKLKKIEKKKKNTKTISLVSYNILCSQYCSFFQVNLKFKFKYQFSFHMHQEEA